MKHLFLPSPVLSVRMHHIQLLFNGFFLPLFYPCLHICEVLLKPLVGDTCAEPHPPSVLHVQIKPLGAQQANATAVDQALQ